ncbi:odorant receptor 131-2-like [Pangasianodon hypophthalmus]|uniref:odorant receptor 131-2-like n=1 Tax=Pangasianodon hypophthalmus TaxID=310915 RepID=UPI000EFEA0DB|nr:odorant receptor 131-2-like [Pangasianodon hypophthalmus]
MQSAGVNTNSSNNLLFNFSWHLNEKILLLQILVGIFLYINCLMIFTFLKKDVFREETRYILFAQTLFVDTAFILLADLLSFGTYFQYRVNIGICSFSFLIQNFFFCCTPLTLVAMCLERYVAICMPLRHAAISTKRNRLYGLFIIWSISSIIPVFSFIGYWAAAPPAALFSYAVCNAEVMLVKEWQAHGRAVIFVILFLFMAIIIVFIYIKIMIVARAASSEKKASTNKSLRTVILHGIQLFLCMMQFFNPYIEMAYYKVEEMTLRNIKYSNLIVFLFVPRSLSPLIYGLRDEKFFHVLRYYALCGTDRLFSTLCEIKQLKIRPI